MIRFKVEDVIKATGGVLLRGASNREMEGVSIDSKTILPGQMFICIIGRNHDGHKFAQEAIGKGAGGLLLSSPAAYQQMLIRPDLFNNGLPAIMVKDTTTALQDFSRYIRKSNPIPLIAVTGSNGKTTTKELIVSILKQKYNVHKNEGNLNNFIGLPLSILQINRMHEVAVLEMGMNRAGEIRLLSGIADPDIGVITNISAAHLGELGSLDNILAAKKELVDSLGSGDTIVLNVKDPYCSQLAGQAKSLVITFGNGQNCSIRCTNIENRKQGRIAFILEVGNQTIPITLNMPGHYNAYNAAAAAAVGLVLKMEPQQIKKGLESYRGLPMRSEIIEMQHGIIIYNDCYNANPESMQEALRTFESLTTSSTNTVILGDMLELGEYSEQFHRHLGRLASSVKGIRLMAVGNYAEHTVTGALEGGLSPEKVFAVETAEEAAELVSHVVDKGHWVMVKGSRGVRLEKVVDRLTKLIGRG